MDPAVGSGLDGSSGRIVGSGVDGSSGRIDGSAVDGLAPFVLLLVMLGWMDLWCGISPRSRSVPCSFAARGWMRQWMWIWIASVYLMGMIED